MEEPFPACPSKLKCVQDKRVRTAGCNFFHVIAQEDVEVGTTFSGGYDVDLNSKSAEKGQRTTWPSPSKKQVTLEDCKGTVRNWTFYLRKSSDADEVNVILVQSHGPWYYIAFKNIGKGEELVLANSESALDYKLPTLTRRSRGVLSYSCYRCFRCNAVFVSLARLGSHLFHWCRHQKLGSICAPTLSDIPSQFRQSIRSDVFQCRSCLLLFLCKDKVLEHILSCSELKIVKMDATMSKEKGSYKYCWICGAFGGNQVMRHERTHFAWESFICEICGKVLRRRDKYFSHRLGHHVGVQSRKKRKNLRKASSKRKRAKNKPSEATDREQEKGTNEKKKFRCSTCDMAFSYNHVLRRHELLHSGVTFKCGFCGSYFKRKDHLSEHRGRMHDG